MSTAARLAKPDRPPFQQGEAGQPNKRRQQIMIKFLKNILPANHGTDRALEVLGTMSICEFITSIVITGLALIVLPMLVLIWDVKGGIA